MVCAAGSGRTEGRIFADETIAQLENQSNKVKWDLITAALSSTGWWQKKQSPFAAADLSK